MMYKEYSAALALRANAVSVNRSRRMQSLPTQPLPLKPTRPKCRIAYTKDGDYIGRLAEGDEVPVNAIIKLEDALY